MSNPKPFPAVSAIPGRLIPPNSRLVERGDTNGEKHLPVKSKEGNICVRSQNGGRR
jgi:hypothetical protein